MAAGQWDVLALKGSQRSTIGKMNFAGEDLVFRWESGTSRSQAAGLRNCVLQLSIGGTKTRRVALRLPVEAPAAVLDLRRDLNTFSISAEDLPDESALSLRLLGLAHFQAAAQKTVEAGYKEPLKIELRAATADSPSVELYVILMKNGTKLNVNVRPVAVSQDGTTMPFTLRSVSAAINQLDRQISAGESKIDYNTKQIPQVQAKILSFNGTVVRTTAEAAAIQNQIVLLQAQIRNMQTEIMQLEKAIPLLEKQLAAMPALKQLSTDLHQKVALRFAVVEQVAGQTVPIYSASAASAEPTSTGR
jgi:hypothetical protein